jgi:hypothetical protein
MEKIEPIAQAAQQNALPDLIGLLFTSFTLGYTSPPAPSLPSFDPPQLLSPQRTGRTTHGTQTPGVRPSRSLLLSAVELVRDHLRVHLGLRRP